ncbi:MAG: M23 family metallopeptidase [Acidimicrobiia bacterium]
MRKRGLSLFLAGFVVATVLPAVPAQAACRPTVSTPAPPAPVLATPTDPLAPADSLAPPPEALPPPAPIRYCSYRYQMLWPVLGGGAIGSTFGADRDGGTRLHAGNDIMAPKMTPVVAVANGTIKSIHDAPGDCCWVILSHDDGWSSWYLHLNNDHSGTDDGRGVGIRPDLVAGTRVMAGEVIGWVGDSGNAEPGPPHLHFELHRPGVGAIDPYPALRRAYRAAPALEGVTDGFAGSFTDDDGLAAEPVFHHLVASGALASCDEWGAAVCPPIAASNLDAASWIGSLARVLIPVRPPPEPGPEIMASVVAIQLACGGADCPEPPLTRGEVMTMLLWAVRQRAYEDVVDEAESGEAVPPPPYWETDPYSAMSQLRSLGLANDCPMLELPLDGLLSRADLAVLVGQAFGLLPTVACGNLS